MGSHQIQKVEKIHDREKILLDHYEWLLDWALRLTRGAREEAEDLVQDLYVRFVQSNAAVDVADEDRLRGYLYKTLRNLSISKNLSAGRDALSSLQAVDYDSVEFALVSVDRSRLLHVRSDLAAICEYACIRRKTSRAGSVLILRFFLCYYPSEIVEILQTTRGAVNKLTETGRLEAKAFLTHPGSLHFMGEDSGRLPSSSQYLPDDPTELFSELRRRIFSEPEGICATPQQIEGRYTSSSGQQLTKQELAHLVSCGACLERTNQLLHLPSLSERFFDGFNDHHKDNSPPPPPGVDGGTVPKLRKKLRDTYEHRPNKLQLAVNGEIRGAQQVTSARSNFQIKLKPLSRPEFIEIFSEQRVCLLYLDLESTDISDPSSKHAEVELSDERSLTVEVSLSGGSPVVNVSYFDPVLDEKDETWAFEHELQPLSHDPAGQQPMSQKPHLARRLWGRLWSRLSFRDKRWPLILVAGAALVACGITLAIFDSPKQQQQALTPPTAFALLTESKQRDELAIPPHGAARQTFAFKVVSGKGKLIESGEVETLRSRTPHRSATRLLSTRGRLLAGRWSDAAGGVTTYSGKHGLQHSSSDRTPQLSFDDAWTHVPDAADFEQISGGGANLSLHQDNGRYELSYAQPADQRSGPVISADLIVAADTMRPVSETIRLQSGQETREYRFQEVSYEILSANQVEESDFAPDAALVSLRSGLAGIPDRGDRAAHLTLEALQLLSNLGPEIERAVDVDRHADGNVELNGVLPTSDEKTAVLRVFQSLRGGSQLKLTLHSSDEATEPVPQARRVKVESVESLSVESQRIPLDPELRSALVSQGLSGVELEGRIRQVANEATTLGAQLHRDGWDIQQIAANDFTPAELQAMQPEDKMLWLTLLGKHLRSFDQELTSLSADLKPLFPGVEASPPMQQPLPSLQNITELGVAAEALNQNSERLDRMLTADLTLSPSGIPANDNEEMIAQLLAALRMQEGTLHGTIERLLTSRQADRPE